MPTYRYRAKTNDDTVFGEIRADNHSQAVAKLSNLGFYDVELEEYGDFVDIEPQKQDFCAFEFEGYKQDGSLVQGTLEASDRLSAIRTLIHQYKIVPEYLCETTAPHAEKQHMRGVGFAELSLELTKEEQALLKKESVLENVLSAAEQDFYREIDSIVQEATDFLEKHKERLSVADYEKLQIRIREILRIKNMRDFASLASLKRNIRDILVILQKKMGEIVDQDIKIFFEALTEYNDIHRYAELIRHTPDIKKKLLIFEIRRLFDKAHRGEAFQKICIVFRGGRLPEEKTHHPAWYEFHRFLGALTFFYLILFGVAYYMTKKEMAYSLPFLESVSRNELLYQISIVLFVSYVLLTLKLYFFRANRVWNVVLGVLWVGVIVWVVS